MRKKLLATLRGLSAVVLMLFATNFLPVAAAFADKPTDPGNGQASVVTGATSPLNYTGQGIPVDQKCDENNTPYLLFIFTYGGNHSPTNVTLHGIHVQSQVEKGNEMHITTDYVDPTTLINNVNVTWSGDVGNAQLVISHGCAGTTDECDNISGIQANTDDCDVCPDMQGVQTSTDDCDACPDVQGVQNSSDDCDVCPVVYGLQTNTDECNCPDVSLRTSTDTNECEVPKPAKPTVSAESTACVEDDSDDGSVTVVVTNTADDTHAAVSYNVTLNGVTKNTGSVADGSTGTVTFTGLAAGNYQATVAGSDDTTAKTNVKVKECKKVFVCKYVGTPGVNERLKLGKNPISVSVKSTGGTAVGSSFNDKQGRSFVLGVDDGIFNPTREDCPAPQGPTKVTPAVQFTEPTCETPTGRVTVTAMTGVTYKVNGTVVTGTTSFAAGSSVTVTAELATGFVLANGAQGSFSHTFAAAPTDCVLGAVTGGKGGDVLGATTTAQLANTGQSPWAAIIVGVTVISLTLTSAFASRRVRLDA